MAARKKEYTVAIGRRKAAVARVRVSTKDADALTITVNDHDFKKYFNYFEWQDIIVAPLLLAGKKGSEISVHVKGGGRKGQAEAIRLGIARALIAADGGVRSALKKAGFLSVDARVKERKKPGLKKARRAPQWSKR